MALDNIVIGKPVDGLTLEQLGILPEEKTLHFSFEEVQNDKGDVFLPALLVKAGLVKSTSEVRRINVDRLKSEKIIDPREKDLWRNLDGFEFTRFKIGKNVFWLIIGE